MNETFAVKGLACVVASAEKNQSIHFGLTLRTSCRARFAPSACCAFRSVCERATASSRRCCGGAAAIQSFEARYTGSPIDVYPIRQLKESVRMQLESTTLESLDLVRLDAADRSDKAGS